MPIILDLAPCEQAEITLKSRTSYAGGAIGSWFFRSASGEVLDSDDAFFVWPPLPREAVDTFLKLGRTFEGSRLYRMDIGPYAGGAPRFSFDFVARIRPRPRYNDAGESLADARPLSIPITVKGNLRGIDPGHYYKVFLKPGEKLPARIELRHGPRFVSNSAFVDVFDSSGAPLSHRSLLGASIDGRSLADDDAVFANATGVAQWFTFHIWSYFGSEQREIIYWLCFGDAPCEPDETYTSGAGSCDAEHRICPEWASLSPPFAVGNRERRGL